MIVEKGEILTVAVGFVIVIVVALIANPQYLAGLQVPLTGPSSSPPQSTTLPGTVQSAVAATAAITTPAPNPVTTPAPVLPYRISYTDKPFTYPLIRLPDRLEILGESDIRRSGQDMAPFAFMADTRGGLSRVFSVPYPVWTMEIQVFDNTTPNVASFRMALCYAANGTIIDGVELIHPGTAFKRIQTSNTPLYLIISTAEIEGYRIDMQTSRQYYEQFGVWQPEL